MAATAKVLYLESDALLARALERTLRRAMPHVDLRGEPDVATATASVAGWTPDALLINLTDSGEWAALDEIPFAEWGTADVDPTPWLGTSPREWRVARAHLPLVAAWRAAVAPRPARVVAMVSGHEGTPWTLLDELHVVALVPRPWSAPDLVAALELALCAAP